MGRPYRGRYYKMIKIVGHPLARAGGLVGVHRVVLYEKIGPGSHPCHWCKRLVHWKSRTPGTGEMTLIADHVNGNREDNGEGNLVPSCNKCNVLRTRSWAIGDHEIYIIDSDGYRNRASEIICLECNARFIAKPRTGTRYERKFCSRRCSGINARRYQMASGA